MDRGTKINKLTGKINTMNEHRKMRYNLITETTGGENREVVKG